MAAEAATAAMMGSQLFDYNRENFMFDRELRMKKEFQELKFRVIQADLWRQDVRDIISLVEMKTKKYLLVNVLMLGFTISLWVQGVLPETTPDWLMLGNQVAIGGAFVFLLLTVWLAMHASISAQAFQTRLLTQLVRLPIPSWEELEAARTYGSSFEKVEARQMFRVPFLLGAQEKLVPEQPARSTDALEAGSALASGGGEAKLAPALPQVPTDPWGLESRGDNTYELGCPYNKECANLRHIRLVRQASQFWQSYDAFARISMSIGANQLILAMSYYILGYVLVQTRSPWAAFAGVICLGGLSQIIAFLDMSLPWAQHLLVTLLIVSGPGWACLATYHWSFEFGEFGTDLTKILPSMAFMSHGILVLFLSYTCDLKDTKDGGMLPLAFKQVLYLDVFGWTSKYASKDEGDMITRGESATALPAPYVEQPEPAPVREAAAAAEASREPVLAASPTAAERRTISLEAQQTSGRERTEVNYYALDYMDPIVVSEPLLGKSGDGQESDEEGELALTSKGEMRPRLPKMAAKGIVQPALQAISYNPDDGHSNVRGIKDFAPAGARQDLRYMSDAPHEHETVSQVDAPKDFFDATSFGVPGDAAQRKFDAAREAADPMVSGHGRELPGRVPSSVFMFGTILLGSVWIAAAVYEFLDANGLTRNFNSFHVETVNSGRNWNTSDVGNQADPRIQEIGMWASRELPVIKRDSHPTADLIDDRHLPMLLQRWSLTKGSAVEQLHLTLPFAHMLPKGLSCDASGRHFAITDGLSTFVGEVAADSGRSLRKQGAGRSAVSVEFKEMARCSALLGEALQDTAIACGGSDSAECEVLLLHHRGKRVAACPVKDISKGRGNVAAIAQRWLQNTHGAEKASWLVLNSDCVRDSKIASRMACTSVGTTHGRVAHLQHSESDDPLYGDLFPDAVLPEDNSKLVLTQKEQTWSPGMVRALNSRFFGVLQRDRGSIQVLDGDHDLAKVGVITLPVQATVDAFCAGGGHVYLLSQGSRPEMWRLPLPRQLT